MNTLQVKILEVMKYIDKLCREHNITYFIMGGTALGAVRHGGFIPWDDDLDIFMTPREYARFKEVFQKESSDKFIIQEWRTTEKHLEYAKVRMNGTTFIEENFKDCRDMHHGIYVDIMILHKVKDKKLTQKKIYYYSKFVTLYGLSKRNWKPKSGAQKIILKSLKMLPCKTLSKFCYKRIYKYDELKEGFKYCYWITPASFSAGLFSKEFFEKPIDIPFEDTSLLGSEHIKEYLAYRYGDYMKLPPENKRIEAQHAFICDTEKDFSEYIK